MFGMILVLAMTVVLAVRLLLAYRGAAANRYRLTLALFLLGGAIVGLSLFLTSRAVISDSVALAGFVIGAIIETTGAGLAEWQNYRDTQRSIRDRDRGPW